MLDAHNPVPSGPIKLPRLTNLDVGGGSIRTPPAASLARFLESIEAPRLEQATLSAKYETKDGILSLARALTSRSRLPWLVDVSGHMNAEGSIDHDASLNAQWQSAFAAICAAGGVDTSMVRWHSQAARESLHPTLYRT